MSNRARTIREVRGRWADCKRGEYLLEREIERSYKRDPIGAEMLTKLVLEPLKKLLDILDGPISEGEDLEFALSLAGINNYNTTTMKRKLDAIMSLYAPLMAELGIEVQLTEKRRVIATLVEGKSA